MTLIVEIAIGVVVAYIGLHVLGWLAIIAIKVLTGDF